MNVLQNYPWFSSHTWVLRPSCRRLHPTLSPAASASPSPTHTWVLRPALRLLQPTHECCGQRVAVSHGAHTDGRNPNGWQAPIRMAGAHTDCWFQYEGQMLIRKAWCPYWWQAPIQRVGAHTDGKWTPRFIEKTRRYTVKSVLSYFLYVHIIWSLDYFTMDCSRRTTDLNQL